MKRRSLSYVLIVCAVVAGILIWGSVVKATWTMACNNVERHNIKHDKVEYKDDNKTETRNLNAFTRVSVSIPAEVHFYQGDKHEIKIEARPDILELIENVVTGNSLEIKFSKWNVRNCGKIIVWLTAQNVERLEITGSASLKAETAVNTEKIKFDVTGSGNISVPTLKANEVKCNISGSGAISLGGSSPVKDFSIDIAGSGAIEAYNIEAENMDADVTGSGACKVNVSGKLKANVTGSGDILYKGNPIVDIDVTGSGKVKKAQ